MSGEIASSYVKLGEYGCVLTAEYLTLLTAFLTGLGLGSHYSVTRPWFKPQSSANPSVKSNPNV